MQEKQRITPFQAIKRMRELTGLGIPFSFEFYSLNTSQGTSDGLKVVAKAELRQGLRDDQSDKAHRLIAYTDHSDGAKPRFFHLSLLMKFNGHLIKP